MCSGRLPPSAQPGWVTPWGGDPASNTCTSPAVGQDWFVSTYRTSHHGGEHLDCVLVGYDTLLILCAIVRFQVLTTASMKFRVF
jgi:hypothetical protein